MVPQTLTLTVYHVLLGTQAIVDMAGLAKVVWVQAAPAGVTVSKKSALEEPPPQVSLD